MKQLTQPQIKKIIDTIMKTEPYKTELNNSYFGKMVRQMLIETIALTQLEIHGDEQEATTP